VYAQCKSGIAVVEACNQDRGRHDSEEGDGGNDSVT